LQAGLDLVSIAAVVDLHEEVEGLPADDWAERVVGVVEVVVKAGAV
jgi:hypothetical protein